MYHHNINQNDEIKDEIKEENKKEENKVIERNIKMEVKKIVRENKGKILLTILARNKAHVLLKYLECIDNLDYNKKLIYIYINTNNNIDNTLEILQEWSKNNQHKYAKIDFE